jgi:uracil-DNA glycosylase
MMSEMNSETPADTQDAFSDAPKPDTQTGEADSGAPANEVEAQSTPVEVNPKIDPSWLEQMGDEFKKPYFADLKKFLLEERKLGYPVYPPGSLIFNAFNKTPFNDVKVVILGQDPYHGPGQAHGLCFSVQVGVRPPPSLVNIFKELQEDVGFSPPGHGSLERWASQGVLLLNACLTVRQYQPGSHHGKGWEQFTGAAIEKLAKEREGLVFMLWGRPAQERGQFIDRTRHYILTAPHPSPFSADRGFFGCKHFSKANKYLEAMGKPPIDWQL